MHCLKEKFQTSFSFAGMGRQSSGKLKGRMLDNILYCLQYCPQLEISFRTGIKLRKKMTNRRLYGLRYFAKRNETKRNGILRNGTLRNGILRNGILRNGTLRNGTVWDCVYIE